MADLSRYKEVQTIEFDRGVKEAHIAKVNDLLAHGWEIIDAKVGEVAKPERGMDRGVPAGWWKNMEYSFILGRAR